MGGDAGGIRVGSPRAVVPQSGSSSAASGKLPGSGGVGFTLRPEQAEAVAWMVAREGAPDVRGGVLADNVGAGKTFVVAALIAEAPLWPTLVLVPKSLIWQWIGVLNDAGLQGDLHVVLGGGGGRRRPGAKRLPPPKLSENRSLNLPRLVLATHGCLLAKTFAETSEIAGRDWGRVVVDEAHCAKNPRSRTHKALCALKASARWALTATPVQNSRADLLALARFLGVVTEDVKLVRDLYVLRRGCGGDSEGPEVPNGSIAPGVARPRRLPPRTVRNETVVLTNAWEKEIYKKAQEAMESAEKEEAEERDGKADEGGGEDGGEDGGEARVQPKGALATPSVSEACGRGRGGWELQLRCRQAATHPGLYFASMAASAGRAGDHKLSVELEGLAAKARALPADEASSKIAFLCADVARNVGEKSVVFCDWVAEMQTVADALLAAGAEVYQVNFSNSWSAPHPAGGGAQEFKSLTKIPRGSRDA